MPQSTLGSQVQAVTVAVSIQEIEATISHLHEEISEWNLIWTRLRYETGDHVGVHVENCIEIADEAENLYAIQQTPFSQFILTKRMSRYAHLVNFPNKLMQSALSALAAQASSLKEIERLTHLASPASKVGL